jgi:uncharacterized Tic20 family protein
MSALPPPNPLEPTQDEKTMASLAQFLQLFGGWIAPLVIFLVKRQSRFVSFHALQVLLLQVVHVIGIIVFVMVWIMIVFGTVFFSIAHQAPGHAEPPIAFFLAFPLIWLVVIGYWVFILITAIVYGIKASQGEWAEYPILGRWARKLLKIGPGGTAFTGSN